MNGNEQRDEIIDGKARLTEAQQEKVTAYSNCPVEPFLTQASHGLLPLRKVKQSLLSALLPGMSHSGGIPFR